MEYTINIHAPAEKVWKTLWNDDTYRLWTRVFSEGSKAVTDWKKGSKVFFVNEQNEGMVSTIAENIPNEFMSIKHLGSVKDGVEDYDSEASKGWAGSYENYTLKNVNAVTELKVNMGGAVIPEEYKEFFAQAWPKALNILKELSEK